MCVCVSCWVFPKGKSSDLGNGGGGGGGGGYRKLPGLLFNIIIRGNNRPQIPQKYADAGMNVP